MRATALSFPNLFRPGKPAIDTVKAHYDALARRDLDAALDVIRDDAIWEFSGPTTIPFAGRWRGRSGVARWVSLRSHPTLAAFAGSTRRGHCACAAGSADTSEAKAACRNNTASLTFR
jgi:ketosteroid isomerase-like protein